MRTPTISATLSSILLLAVTAFTGCAAPAAYDGPVLVAPRGAAGARIEAFVTTAGEAPRQATGATVRWDDIGLTVTFVCEDDQIIAVDRERDDPQIWKDDTVEVFLDPAHRHDHGDQWFHFIVSANGVLWDESGPVSGFYSSGDPMNGQPDFDAERFRAEVARTDTGWTAEVRIAWADLGVTPTPGDVWSFNLARTNHPIDEYTCYIPTHGVFLRPERWGHLAFVDAGADPVAARQAVARTIAADHARVAAEHQRLADWIREQRDHAAAQFARERGDGPDIRMWHTGMPDLGDTSVRINGEVYGARPDERGPIGGGAGYTAVVTEGDYHVTTLDELIDALSKAQAGEVVFVAGDVVFDCTTRVHNEKLVLEVPAGVTLASDRGHDGSPGALIHSDAFTTRPLIRANGADVRITGLRLRGPDPETRQDLHVRSSQRAQEQDLEGGFDREYYYQFPTSDGIMTEHPRLEVDNCDLAGWSHAAVWLRRGDGHHIHHNFIHHNQRHGLGYGVSHDISESLIEYNLFNYNRHSIAATGRSASGYEARHNVEIQHSVSHCFDMHGGSDRKDGTNIAGTWMKVHHNTFRSHAKPIRIRGTPEQEAVIHHNWFYHHRGDMVAGSLNPVDTQGRTRVYNNASGVRKPQVFDLPSSKAP